MRRNIYDKPLRPYRDGDVSEYCSCCGRKLQRRFYHYNYDEHTGKELFGIKLFCPAPWFLFWQGHHSQDFSPKGFEIITYYN